MFTRGCAAVGRIVFINYRGEDSHSYGALLYTELARQFGDEHVFLDCESIPAGADFVEELLGRVRSARVVLAIIGPRWLTATDATGRRRIDNPADWIRRELAEAFSVGVRVIPVLTEHAATPAAADLPPDIAALSRCQYRHLRYREPTADLARIVTDLTSLDPALAAAARLRDNTRRPPPVPPTTGRMRKLLIGAAIVLVVLTVSGDATISAPKALADGQSQPCGASRLALGHFCAYSGINFTGQAIDMFACRDYTIPWAGRGSWINNQTSGTRAQFKSSDGVVRWTSDQPYTDDRGADWSWVHRVRPC
jgi:hypothetical protein